MIESGRKNPWVMTKCVRKYESGRVECVRERVWGINTWRVGICYISYVCIYCSLKTPTY